MQKIRSNAALLVGVIGIAMVMYIFFVQSNFGAGGTVEQKPLGEIYGKQMDIKKFMELYQGNLENDGNPGEPAKRAEVWQRTWDGYINQQIFDKEYKSCGNEVSEKELSDVFQNPAQNSELRMIRDFQENGQYSPARVFAFLKQAADKGESDDENDKRLVRFMKSVEEYVYLNRLRDKYFGLLKKAAFVTKNEQERAYNDKKRKAEFNYMVVNYNTISDSDATVSADDLRKYYNNHKEMFRRDQDEADLKYVYFEKLPAQADTQAALNYLDKLVTPFQTAKNDTSFVGRYQGTLDTVWQSASTLPKDLLNRAGEIAEGAVIGPVLNGASFSLYKVEGTQQGTDAAIKMRHIKFNFGMPSGKEDSANVRKKAETQKATITSGNFADAARLNSDDQQTKMTGGNLGWVTFPSTYGEEFDKAVKNAATGSFVIAPMQGGYGLIEIENRTTLMVKMATINREIFAGSQTIKNVFQVASRFALDVEKLGDIDKAAEANPGINVRKTATPISSTSTSILGIPNAQKLINWGLSGNKGDRTKEILETETAFVIAEITDKREKGYKRLDEIEAEIRPKVMNNKKARMIFDKIKGLNATTAQDLVTAYGNGASMNTIGEVVFSNQPQGMLGNEPKVFGRAFGSPIGELSKPIAGNAGVFVIQVTKIVQPEPAQPQDLMSEQFGLMFPKQQVYESRTYQALKEVAEVVDLRRNYEY